MKILTDEEVTTTGSDAGLGYASDYDLLRFARAIESAVVEKLNVKAYKIAENQTHYDLLDAVFSDDMVSSK